MKALNYTYINFLSVISLLSSFPLLIHPPLVLAQSPPAITPATDGTGTIVQPQGDRWQITGGSYNSDRTNLFHSFQRFNVPNGQTANFLATPQLKNILGRVTGGEASFINGLMQVTGGRANLFLINPAGMIFGPNASLNIPAAFTATTATGIGFGNSWWSSLGTNDYANDYVNNYENLLGSPNSFAFSLNQPASIVNQANLTVNAGQSIHLAGGLVVNTGNLTAAGGNITLTAVADQQILRIAQTGHLLNLEVAPLNTSDGIRFGENITPLTLPTLLTGNSQDHATEISINNLGQVVLANHSLILAQPGTVISAGEINVANPQGKGGNVTILGDRMAVMNTMINASGKDGGGTVLIGGDWQGQGKFNAQQTFVNEQSVINANAEDRGNGGKVVIWSDHTTKFAGEITATGGQQAGDGGLVEISGKQDLVFRGKVDVGGINGQVGNILFDPENIVIDQANTLAVDEDYTLTIDANNINQLTGVINLQADNDITINRAIATDQAVTLSAGRSININADIDTAAGNGNINLLANNDDANLSNRQTGVAHIQMLDGTSLKAGSGNITLQLGSLGTAGNISLSNLISTGTVTIDANRGNILPTSANALITANNLTLNTVNNGGIGLIDTPLQIEVNNLEAIAGSKGMFINATKPVNIGSIDGTNLGLKTEKKGNINLTVTGDLTLTDHVTTATDDQTAAGNINLTSTGNINGTTSVISTNSFNGQAGNIKLTATGDIDTGKIQTNAGLVSLVDEMYSSEGGSGHAGNITLQAGGLIKTNDISAYSVLGNSGAINLTAEQAITTGKLQNFAGYNSNGDIIGTGDSGKINLISNNAGISTGKIESFAGHGNPADLTVTAYNNIAIAGIDSFTNGDDGNGSLVNITSKNGAINIKNPLELSVTEGLGSTVNLTADRNINLAGINADAVNNNAGNLTITSKQGAINISGDLNFTSFSGNGGQVLLDANQNITTVGINTKSQEQGNAGHIQLISNHGVIDTTNGSLDASAQGMGGDVDLQAQSNINTSGINTSGEIKSGNITITSTSGMANTTEGDLTSYSVAGTPGNITIKASGDITTSFLTTLSFNREPGGVVNITSNNGKIDTTQGNIDTWSEAGTGNQVTLQALGNINLGNIDTHGLQEGGAVNITSQQGSVTMNLADTTINSSATQGIPGNVNITGNGLVTVRAINAGGENILGDVNLTSETNDVIFNLNEIIGNLIVNTPNGNIDLTGPQNIKIVDGGTGDPFTTQPVKNINSDADLINHKPARIVNLQAHNDITLNEAIQTNQQIKELNMQAGRSIKVNADIDTSAGNGQISLLANQADQNNIYRQTGAGSIIMADGTTLKAGRGNINLALGGTEQIGNITLANLQTKGNIQVNALGGNIFTRSNNTVIKANQLTLQTTDIGGIGQTNLPLRLQVNVLEANAGSGGVFLQSLQGLTIGSDDLPLSGITTNGGAIRVIAEQGDILIEEPLTTAGNNQNAGNITLKSLAGNIMSIADINSQAISTADVNSSNTRSTIINAGDVTLEASGNITTNNILSSATGNNNAGNITLTAGQNIDTSLGKLSAESVDGLAGIINLTAFGDINTGEIFSQATGFGSGGNILIDSTDGSVQTDGVISSTTIDGTKSGDINISADSDVSIQEKVYSRSEGTGEAGDINITSKQGNITSEQLMESSSNKQAGNITLQAEGDITIDQLNSRGKDNNANAGTITVTSETGNILANQGLYSDSNSGIGGNITLDALTGAVTTQDIRTFSRDENNTAGTGGDVNITAQDAININQDIESLALDESGDVIIRSASGVINTQSILTRADNGTSGDIQLNTYSQEGDIQTANLTTIGNQAAGQVAVIAADGNIITKDLTSQSNQGSSGGINTEGNNITTGDQTVISATGDSTITNTAKGSLFVGNQRAIANQGDANITNQAGGDLTTGDQTAITNTGNVSLINQAGGDINVGDQTAITNTGNVTIANTATNITAGNQTAITNTGNALINNIATGNINVGNQTAMTNNGNALINNNAGVNLTTGEQRAIALGGINQVTNTAGGEILTGRLTEGNNIAQPIVNNNLNLGNNPIIANNINNANITNNPASVAVNTVSTPVIITSPGVSVLPVDNNFNSNIVNNLPTVSNNILRTETNPLVNNNLLTNPNQVNNHVNNTVNNLPITNINSPNQLPTISSGERLINIAKDFTVNPTNQDFNVNLQNSFSNNPTNQLKTDLPVLQNLQTATMNLVNNSANINLLEMNRNQEFNSYFGENLIKENQPSRNIRDILTYIREATGHQSAILYVNAYPQELQLVLYTPDGQTIVQTVPEANRENLMRVVEEFKTKILDPKERNSQSYLPSAQQLYNWLINPLQAYLDTAQIDTLLFSMDAGLRGIPLAALHDGQKFLIEKYSFSLIPSISLTDTTYRSMHNTQVLAMGASEFETLNDLPAVPIELSTIADQLWQGQDFLNEDFTLNNLVSQRQKYPYPIIHLATHAEFQPGLVNNSFIQLWDDKLRLDQVRQLGWNNPTVELLVLSACRTAVGDRNAELGFAGLAIATGVKSALASLWYVSDAGTLGLMTEFYVHLQNSSIKADALRKAQLAMLQGQVSIEGDQLRGSQERGGVLLPPEIIARGGKTINFTHPYYWSGFTMIGSPW